MSQEFFEHCAEYHMKWMIEVKDPKVFSVLFMKKDSSKKIAVIPMTIVGNELSPLDVTKQLVLENDPDSYLIVSEAWVKFLDKNLYRGLTDDQLMNMFKRGEIEKMPSRKEILMVVGRNKNGKNEYTKQYLIIRNEKNHVIDFEPMEQGKFVTRKLP